MTYPEIVMQGYQHYYPNGGDELENVRFFADLALRLATKLEVAGVGTPQEIADLVTESSQAEKELKRRTS